MEDYFEAKALLFGPTTAASVIVVDDEWGQRLAARVAGAVTVSTTAAVADWRARDVVEQADGSTRFEVDGPGGIVHRRLRHSGPLQRRERRAGPRRAGRRRRAD